MHSSQHLHSADDFKGTGFDGGTGTFHDIAQAVVEVHGAAPGAVVTAARHRVSPGEASPGEACTNQPSAPQFSGWQFRWGVAGSAWSTEPPTESADRPAEPPVVCLRSVFDLASLTKPLTALTLACCQRAGLIDRYERLGDLLPELSCSRSADLPLDLFLAHRSGLEAHREFFTKAADASQPTEAEVLAEAADARRVDCPGQPPEQGFRPVYSDLGYILVGAALSRRAACPLDELVARHVAEPLGLSVGSIRRLHAADPTVGERLVATEHVPWRGGTLVGVVHDENAWVLAGDGSAGHAGQFGDAASLVRLGVAIVDAWTGRRDDWLCRADLEPLVHRRPGGTHCAGFDRRAAEGPSSGRLFGPETFGHLGFTGTSLWIDPQRQLVGVLLTNRVHPTRNHDKIRCARPAVYDAIYEAM